ncbi:MAG: polysaccharide biosynthesis C-terminal domain-containing protein [Bacteroidales bacterium]
MKRKFLTNLTLLVFLNLLVKPFWVLGIDLTVQNRVGTDEYGFYFSLLSFSLLLNIVQDMGIASYNNRNIARNHDLISKLLPNILVLKLLLAAAYFLISLTVAFTIGYQWIQLKLLVVLLFNQFLNSMNLYLRSNIGGLQLFRTDSLLSVTDRALMIVICSLLLWGNVTSTAFSIESFVYAQTASYFLTMIITLLIVLKHVNLNKMNLDFSVTLVMLKKSYPYALLGLLMILYYRTDSVMLERMLTNGKLYAGIYAQGFRILDAASMLGFLFAGILLPMFAKMIKHNEPVGQLFRFSFLLLIIPAITGSVAMNFYSYDIMDLLYKSHADEAGKIFGTLMISFVFLSCSIISGTLLTANGSIKQLNIIAVFSVLMNIILNLILIPHYQALGSAIASLSTQLFTATFQMILLMKIFNLYPGKKIIIRLIFFIVILIITGYLFSHLNTIWWHGFILTGVTGILAAFTIKLLTFKEIKDALL